MIATELSMQLKIEKPFFNKCSYCFDLLKILLLVLFLELVSSRKVG